METNGAIANPGTLNLRVPEVKQDAKGEDLDGLLLQYERIEIALRGLTPMADLQPDEPAATTLVKQVQAYTKLLIANVAFVRDLDGVSLKLTPSQRERLDEVEDSFDDLLDTLSWTLGGREALQELISEELR